MAERGEVAVRVFWLPKRGSTPAEYEDAYAVQDRLALPFRAAVADGATESAFARTWAERLAKGWLERFIETPDSFASALTEWQEAWNAQLAAASGTLPWYAAAKAEEGAYATFLGLSVQSDGTWQASAVGDCCLFLLRADGTQSSWPLETPESFNNTPGLVPSMPGRPVGRVLKKEGRWGRGDAFLLASDAAAAWLMGQDARLFKHLTPGAFALQVEEARTAGRMRNDDVTVVVIALN